MRTWWLRIIRNTCQTRLYKKRRRDSTDIFNEGIHRSEFSASLNSEIQDQVPDVVPEALVLREMEGMSYKAIAGVPSVSMGTVTQRLAWARTRLRHILSAELSKGY